VSAYGVKVGDEHRSARDPTEQGVAASAMQLVMALFRRELENDVCRGGQRCRRALLDVHLGGEMPENLDAMARAAVRWSMISKQHGSRSYATRAMQPGSPSRPPSCVALSEVRATRRHRPACAHARATGNCRRHRLILAVDAHCVVGGGAAKVAAIALGVIGVSAGSISISLPPALKVNEQGIAWPFAAIEQVTERAASARTRTSRAVSKSLPRM